MKLRLLILFLLVGFIASGQTPTNYTKINAKYAWIGTKADSALHWPGYSTQPNVRTGVFTGAGNVGLDTVNHHPYYYSGSTWRRFGTVYNITMGYGLASTQSPLITTGTMRVDSASLFSNLFGTLSLTTTGTGAATWNSTTRILNIPTPSLTTYYNSNIGSGYRLVVPNTNNIKTLFGAGILSIDSVSNSNALTLTATEVDGSTSNELQTIAVTGTTTGITTLSNGGGSMTIAGAGINTVGVAGSTITITGTEVDGSTTNEIQTLSGSGTTTPIITLSDGGGTFSLTGAGIAVASRSGTDITITATEVDGSTSNELQTISLSGTTTVTNTLSNSGGAWTLTGAGIAAISRSGNDVTVTATEVDGSTSNELQTISTSGTTTPTVTLSNGGGSFSITGAGIAALSRSGDAFTVTATEVDGSITNELQTIANTSDATSHTVTLSNTGGSFQLIEGSGVTLTTGGSGSDGTITIAASSQRFGVSGEDATATQTRSFEADGNPFTIQNTSADERANFTLQDSVVQLRTSSLAVSTWQSEIDVRKDSISIFPHSGILNIDSLRSWTAIADTSNKRLMTWDERNGRWEYFDGYFPTNGSSDVLTSQNNAGDFQVDYSGGGYFKLSAGSGIGFGFSGGSSNGVLTISTTALLSFTDGSGFDGTVTGTALSLTTSLTTGSVAFIGSSGALSQDNSNFFYDNSNDFLGLGTNVPDVRLDVTGDFEDVYTSEIFNGHVNGQGLWVGVDNSSSSLSIAQFEGSGGAKFAFKSNGAFEVNGDAGSSTEWLRSTGSTGSPVWDALPDGSSTNEIQTFTSSSDATSITWTLASGGSLTLIEGDGIDFTIGGTSADPTVTINGHAH